MSEDTRRNVPGSDERAAVVLAEAAAQGWRAVVHAQQAAVPDHGDFYELAGHVVTTLRALEALSRALAGQVTGYGQGRVLRDDQGWDPVLRLAEAADHLGATREFLAAAERAANQFWSSVSHVAVEVQS